MPSVVAECQNNESFVSCSVKNSLQIVMMSRSSGWFCNSVPNITVISVPFTCWSSGASGCIAVKVLH